MFDVGASFPVYFDDAHPDQSYAPTPPRMRALAVMGAIWLVFGTGLLIFGRHDDPDRHEANREQSSGPDFPPHERNL
jgi:hypothetical protein